MTNKQKYYTTKELSQVLKKKINKYGSKQALNQALHRNQKNQRKDSFLSAIWDVRIKVGKNFGFEESKIDRILGDG